MQILYKSLCKCEAQTAKKKSSPEKLMSGVLLFNSQLFKLDFDGAESF